MGSSIERCIRIQHDADGNSFHERRESAFVPKCLQERFFTELADNLGSDSTTDVQASHCFRLEGKITRLCSIDGNEQVQGLDAQFIFPSVLPSIWRHPGPFAPAAPPTHAALGRGPSLLENCRCWTALYLREPVRN